MRVTIGLRKVGGKFVVNRIVVNENVLLRNVWQGLSLINTIVGNTNYAALIEIYTSSLS